MWTITTCRAALWHYMLQSSVEIGLQCFCGLHGIVTEDLFKEMS